MDAERWRNPTSQNGQSLEGTGADASPEGHNTVDNTIVPLASKTTLLWGKVSGSDFGLLRHHADRVKWQRWRGALLADERVQQFDGSKILTTLTVSRHQLHLTDGNRNCYGGWWIWRGTLRLQRRARRSTKRERRKAFITGNSGYGATAFILASLSPAVRAAGGGAPRGSRSQYRRTG